MFEKVNPAHPDKVADRIAGAVVDIAYETQIDPKVAVEVLIGHGVCHIIAETSAKLNKKKVVAAVRRIAGAMEVDLVVVPQDAHLARNQAEAIRCGDNGIFKGVPMTKEQKALAGIARDIYAACPFDGKYILNGDRLIICQSNAKSEDIRRIVEQELTRPYINRLGFYEIIINPLGDWTGGTDVDSGATNRKLGSDMGDAVTGGGLHGKDLSKADVSVNIMCHILALESGQKVEACCAIGDEEITFRYANGGSVTRSFAEVVAEARDYIKSNHYDFETFAMRGLI